MANVNDVRDTKGQIQRALYRLRGAVEMGDINPDDYDAIREYTRHRRRDVEPLTLRDEINNLRISAERTHKPLVRFDGTHDTDVLLEAHEQAGVQSESGLNNHIRPLRGMFRYLDERDRHDDYPWHEHINYVEMDDEQRKYYPEDILDEREVTALRRNMTYQRDKTAMELMYDAGLRIGAACQLRVGHIDRESEPPRVTINREGESQKDAESQGLKWIPLKDSVQQLRTWLSEGHPEAPDPHPDAPLFPILKAYDRDNRDECAVAPRAIRDQIEKAAENVEGVGSGGNEKGIGPHAFRHACVKRLKWKYDMDWNEIGDRLCWRDSMVSKMAQLYGPLTDEERQAKQIGTLYGHTDDDDDDEPTEVECYNCGRMIPPEDRYCGACGADQESSPEPDDPEEAFEEYLATHGEEGVKQVVDMFMGATDGGGESDTDDDDSDHFSMDEFIE